ncbi:MULTISPECIES: cytochrome c3 family protein [Gordonibacter]|uniref:Cytochrome c3 family protein n=1 Tax=Gordonibacter faecis TaxID=3047475 RepID=A0ABT7DLK3_9ACTN|nr:MULTISPECIES: cytochrome c3 family protein [unclassified Gordonibacter]MDJ1650404.1 cytochrome c3 family protein [Gordonibacter sp. KGMB12511]HIW76751.1 hypothetical protein [Candidatus Gordonibacter avicola]
MTEKQSQGCEEPQTEPLNQNDSRKRLKRRRVVTVLSVIAVVIIGAGAGFWVWHEQPSFCGTMCHDTMGSYLNTYEGDQFLVAQHAGEGVVCLDCHEADPQTQLAELQVQLSGDYRVPLAKMDTDDEFCLRDGCHTREDIVQATSSYTAGKDTAVNPHEMTFSTNYGKDESPHEVTGEPLPCATCHTMHRASAGIDYCYDSCHHTKTFESCYSCHDHR